MADTVNLDQIQETLLRTNDMLYRMDEEYKKFWASFNYDPGNAPTCNGQTLGPLDCCTLGDNPCAHKEVDLLERVQRLTARPPILTRDDLANQGVARVHIPSPKDRPGVSSGELDPRKNATCFAEDHVCQALLAERTYPETGWQVQFQLQTPGASPLQEMRRRAREFTINPDGSIVGDPPFPFAVPAKSLTPVYDVAPDTILSPKK
mgnify:CR=1 FL=1